MSTCNRFGRRGISQSIEGVARDLLGDPVEASHTELRYGTNGSLSIDRAKGVYYDFEGCEGGGVVELVCRTLKVDKVGALDWLRERGHIPSETRPQIIAEYNYHDERGDLLFQVVRLLPKNFRQRRRENGRWIWNTRGVSRVLYRLPQLIAAVADGRTIFIAEGEKGVEALVKIGADATCSPGGAGKWKGSYSAVLEGARVVVLPDNDPAGRAHAVSVAASLHNFAADIRILEIPGLRLKGDVVDWIEEGGTADLLAKLVESAGEYRNGRAEDIHLEKQSDSTGRVVFRPTHVTNLVVERVESLVPNIRFNAGELHIAASQGEAALLTSGVPIYQRGQTLVKPIEQEVSAAKGRSTSTASLVPLSLHGLLDALGTHASWERNDARSGNWVRIDPPQRVR